MKSKAVRISVDVAMTALFVALMGYSVTGNRLHERLGVILFGLFILHHALNKSWYKTVFRGKYTPCRVFMTMLNTMLFAAMLGMMVSGIMLSRDVFGFLHLRGGIAGMRLHMLSTSWGYLLMSMHIGLHWGAMVGILQRKSKNSVVLASVAKVLTAILSVVGVYALAANRFVERLFLRTDFAFFYHEEIPALFYADYLCIMILFCTLSYYFALWLKKR